jgi:flagellar motor switch protein FliN/FliY
MKTFFDCWAEVAAALFSQALAGEPELGESLPRPFAAGSFGWAATLAGEVEGRFAVLLDPKILKTPLLGESTDQKTGWKELLRETFDAAARELLARTSKNCRVASVAEIAELSQVSSAFQLRSGDRTWTILLHDESRVIAANAQPETGANAAPASRIQESPGVLSPSLSAGLELLLDVELDASLRFGAREMPLGEILDLGPGDVVELDRHVTDPVDLVVGDKILARGEVVLINGNFALRVTEVAAPKKRLESVRCLF